MTGMTVLQAYIADDLFSGVRSIRCHGLEPEAGKAEIELRKKEGIELLQTTDSLLFLRNEIEAKNDNLPQVLSFIEQHMEENGCPPKVQMQLSVAAEESSVNISNYAYAPGIGKATVRYEYSEGRNVLMLKNV